MLEEEAKASGKQNKSEQTQTLTEDRRAGSGEELAREGRQGGATEAHELDRGRGAGGGVSATPSLATPSGADPLRTGSPLPPGDPSRYELVDEHARGGLGRILRARDNHLGRTVAVKELLNRSPSTEARFVREAMITARLQHPGIVPVHEAGRWPSGDPYYVMKLISGSTLKERVAACDDLGERVALLPLVIAVAEAIAYAHSKNIIHRDLKPSNVVVGEFGESVVVDWGLAKDLAEQHAPAERENDAPETAAGSGSSSADATADVVGTPAYMPPEQASGDDVDKRADVYSLGALLYQVLTGQAPYSSQIDDIVPAKSSSDEGDARTSSDRLTRVLEGPPRPIAEIDPAIPADLVAVVEKAMSRDRRDRYPDARALVDDLKRFATGKLVTAQEYTTVELMRRWLVRNKGAVAAGVAGLVAVSVLGALAVNRIIDERNTARKERAQARAAQRAEEDRATELVYQQAVASLERDPTAAIAWLKRYPSDGPRANRVADMAEEARASGVATHVFQHGDWVHAIDFTADSKRLLSASEDGIVSLWDLESGGRELLVTERGGIRAAATTKERAAYGSADGTIYLIDLASRESTELRGHTGACRDLKFIGDSGLLLSVADDQTVRIWDLATGRTKRVLQATSKPSRGGDNASGTVVVAIGDSGVIGVHDVVADTRRDVKVPAFEPSQALTVSEDGKLIGSVGRDGKVRLIDLEAKTVTELGEHPMQTDFILFSEDGRKLVTAGNDTTVRVWDLEGGKHRVLRGHTDSVYQVDFSPDGTRLISAGDDGTARIWDLRTGAATVLRGHADDVWKVTWSPDGSKVATASLDGSVRIWPTRFDDSRVLVGHDEAFVAHVDWTEAGLMTQGRGGQLLRWNLERGAPTELARAWPGYQYPHWQAKRPISFSADRRFAAAVRADGRVDLWSLDGGEARILELPEGVERVSTPPALSADGSRVAASNLKKVIEWNLAGGTTAVIERADVKALAYDRTGQLVMGVIDGPLLERGTDGDLRSLRTDGFVDASRLLFSSTGAVLAASAENRVLLMDRETGDTMTVSTDGHALVSGALSRDGRWFAGAGADRLVYLWETESGRQRVLAGHDDLVHGVVFSPDGRLLASSSYDKTVRLWEIATGRVKVLRGHGHSVDDLDFSPDGRQLASVARDGTVRIWKIPEVLSVSPESVRPKLDELTTATISGDEALPVTDRVPTPPAP